MAAAAFFSRCVILLSALLNKHFLLFSFFSSILHMTSGGNLFCWMMICVTHVSLIIKGTLLSVKSVSPKPTKYYLLHIFNFLGMKEQLFYITMHSIHFVYNNMGSDLFLDVSLSCVFQVLLMLVVILLFYVYNFLCIRNH